MKEKIKQLWRKLLRKPRVCTGKWILFTTEMKSVRNVNDIESVHKLLTELCEDMDARIRPYGMRIKWFNHIGEMNPFGECGSLCVRYVSKDMNVYSNEDS